VLYCCILFSFILYSVIIIIKNECHSNIIVDRLQGGDCDICVVASNLLLLRLMVQKGLPTEGISLLAFSPDMIICPVHYVSSSFCSFIVKCQLLWKDNL